MAGTKAERSQSGYWKRGSGTESFRFSSTYLVPYGKRTQGRTVASGGMDTVGTGARPRAVDEGAGELTGWNASGAAIRSSWGGEPSGCVAWVYDFQAPYWRARYPDRGCEELRHRELISGAAKHRSVHNGRGGFPAGSKRREHWGTAGSTHTAGEDGLRKKNAPEGEADTDDSYAQAR